MNRYAVAAGIILLFALPSGIALYAVRELQQLQTTVASLQNQLNPPSSYAMRSVGTGDGKTAPYTEWVGLYPESTLYPIAGAPSLRFSDQAPANPDQPRDFEIGFYKYGPTWYTRNGIIEFWIGSGSEDGKGGGILSIAGNNNGGGEVNVRNPTDTDGISLAYHDAAAPTISTEHGTALHFSAKNGLIADDLQTFEQGIALSLSSGYAGHVSGGNWRGGTIFVPSDAINDDSLVLITPLSQPKGYWWVSHLETKRGFTVSSSASSETMDFNWVVIGGADD